MSALEIRNRVRFAAAQQAWDDALPEDDEPDEIADRFDQIELARKLLTQAEKHLEKYETALCDQCMADAMGALVP